jgi:hypothetical protein
MIEEITISRYVGGQIHGISAALEYLERFAPGAVDPVPPGPESVAARPGGGA